MRNKIIAAVSTSALLGLVVYATVQGILLEVGSALLVGVAISAIFYVIYESTLEWLDGRDARNKATEANKKYFDKIRNMKSKPPRK